MKVVVLLLGVLCYCIAIECVRVAEPENLLSSKTQIDEVLTNVANDAKNAAGKEKSKDKKAAPVSFSIAPRKTRRLTALAGHKVPLIGNLTYWGEYFAYVGIGTPPQYVNLQVDTGSTDLIVYTPGCYGCPNTTYLSYDPSKSNTAYEVNCNSDSYNCGQCYDGMSSCHWEDDYGDGSSIKGNVWRDIFTVGNLTSSSSVSLGGITTSTVGSGGFEPTGVDGIWGFAFEKLSGWGGQSVFEHLVGDFNWYDGFSMCLLQDGGVLSLGVDYSKDPRFKWTPISDEEWYGVSIDDLQFGGKSIGLDYYYLNYGGAIIDSGTTLFIVTDDIFKAIKTTIESFCSKANLVGVCGVKANQSLFDGQCFAMTPAQVNQFPVMTISLPGLGMLPVQPSAYLWQGTGVPGQYCLGIQGMDIAGLGVILGDVIMQGYHVAFDKNLDRIGFGPLSSCPSASSSSSSYSVIQ